MRSLLTSLLQAFVPATCALCAGSSQAAVCSACQDRYMGLRTRCPRCANPMGDADRGRECGACQSQQPAYDATFAAADYAAPLDQLALQLKFGAVLPIAPFCAQAIEIVIRGHGAALPELLLPVPLGPGRLVERGFNQALEIARPLARRLGRPMAPRLCVRVHDTRAQSSVAPGERQANIRNAFALSSDGMEQVRGRHIGVIDDVMTSGHTLNEVAGLLKRHGAARVSNLVFARTPPHPSL